MAHPTSMRLSSVTERQLKDLAERYGNQTTALTVAIDRLWRDVMNSEVSAREYVGFDQTIRGGDTTEEELAACRAVGMVNGTGGLFECIDRYQERAPDGWRVTYTDATHDWHPAVPTFPNAASEPILLGFVRVHAEDPHYPIWIYKTKA